jgi:hypothetical protein
MKTVEGLVGEIPYWLLAIWKRALRVWMVREMAVSKVVEIY